MPLVADINAQEKEFEKLSDEDLKSKTLEFKRRLISSSSINSPQEESLEEILPEAFAAVLGRKTNDQAKAF